MANINLSELFTQIGLSMQEAQQKIEQFNYLTFINQFKNVNNSNDENSSILVPKTQQFSFKINDTTQILDVPIITLFNHNNLNLSEVKVSLNIKNLSPIINYSISKWVQTKITTNQIQMKELLKSSSKKILPMKALHVSNKKLLNNFNFYK